MTNFKMNSLQQKVFSAIAEFNKNASFEYAEWVIQNCNIARETPVNDSLTAIEQNQLITVPDNFASFKVNIRKMRNGRNIAKENEQDFLVVNIGEEHLARQIDEISISFNSLTRSWSTATVTRANGKQIVGPYPTVPQFLKRANDRAKRKHGFAQNQPFNFCFAAYR